MEIVRKIIVRSGLEQPDGRPLYAYMITADEFLELKYTLERDVAVRGQITISAAPAFVAFVAEHFGRGDGTDWWSWDSVRAALGLRVEDGELRDATRLGLRHWRRPLQSGARGLEYLATLVCEGGLPLSLLKQEGARLRRYFGELLRLHESYPQMSLRALAAREAEVLPIRMRNEVVFELATTLIEAVALSRADGRPSQELPATLPLRLDDAVARALVDGLRAAPRVRERDERGVIVRTTLQLKPELLLRRALNVPTLVSKSWLGKALGAIEIPTRVYLSIQAADGVRQSAAVGDLRDDLYMMRSLPVRDIVRERVVAEQLRCVVSDGQRDLGAFVPRGGEALAATPWTFEEDGSLRSVGSVITSAPTTVLLLPTKGSVACDGTQTDLGVAAGRRCVRLAGALRWTSEGDRIRVETGAATESEHGEFMLRGATPPALVRETDIWRGIPQVVETTKEGVARTVKPEHVVWRAGGGAWVNEPPGPMGVFEVGVRRNDEIEFRARVRVLPADLRLSILDVRRDGGVIDIRTAAVADAGAVPQPGFSTAPTRTAAGWALVFARTSEAPLPATASVCLRARSGAELVFTVPFPAQRVGFVNARGTLLAEGEPISIDALAHLRVEVRSPKAGLWSVDLVRRGAQPRPILSLTASQGSGAEAPLEPLRSLVSAALAAGASLDEQVELRLVEEGGARKLPTCFVRRYDAQLEPAEINGEKCVRLTSLSRARLDPTVLEALRAEAISLYRPNETVVELVRRAPGVWSLGALTGHPGPWIALALQNDYVRTRPLRVPGLAPASESSNPVDRAVGESDAVLRREAIHDALEQLPSDISLPGWQTVRAQLDGATRLHPTTFDVVRGVTAVPRIAVLALLAAGERSAAIWNALEELPFMWAAIPLRTWLTEIGASIDVLRRHLTGLNLKVDDIARKAGAGIFEEPLAPFLTCIHEAAYRCHPNVPTPRIPIVGHPQFRESCRALAMAERDDLLRRHAAARWPTETAWDDLSLGRELNDFDRFVAGQPGYRAAVLRTPIVLARRIVEGEEAYEPYELRRLRDFDPIWFDRALVAALSTILGRRLDRKEWPFDE